MEPKNEGWEDECSFSNRRFSGSSRSFLKGVLNSTSSLPPKTRASVGGRALDQVIIDQKMQKQLCQVENSDLFFNEDGRWDLPKTGGKLTMNYLPVLEGSKKANIY